MTSTNRYVDEINEILNLDKGSIEIKKKFIYEKDIRSKVLIIYVIENKAKKIDSNIIKLESKRVKYISYKYTSLAERMIAICTNEIINIKERYEILYKVKIKDKVAMNKKKYDLVKLLASIKVNEISLFLTIEQGAGSYKNYVNTVLNPRVKRREK